MKNAYIRNRFIGLGLFLIMAGLSSQVVAQPIPAGRITDWSKAGVQDTIPSYTNVESIMAHGGINNGLASNHSAFLAAVSALGGNAGVIYFPAGTYLFTQPISIGDSLVIRGAGKDSTKLLFDLGGAFQNMINIEGTIGTTQWPLMQTASKNDTNLILNSATGLNTGDWVMIADDDSSKVTSPWAYGSTGQIFQIENIAGTTIEARQVLRRNYPVDSMPYLKRITPVTGSGVECLYLERLDSTGQQTNNIYMNHAVNCWVVGVESNKTNFAHIGINASAHIQVRGNYLHHSHGYGGGGRGYGVVLQYTSGDCLVDNNIFEFLRHSMLLQLGANGNVLSYNYSKDPNWIEPSLPANSAGDMVLHGDYPYLNLFEGNIVQQIVVDNSHGINGPYNTFFRNRAQLYGIFMNTGTGVTDSVNYVGNEVTNTGPFMGNFSLAGTGHLLHGNIIKGTVMPANSTVQEHSIYLNQMPPYWTMLLMWPPIGTPNLFNQPQNPAQLRYGNSTTDCRANPEPVGDHVKDVSQYATAKVYPNPSTGTVMFELDKNVNAVIYVSDVIGRRIAQLDVPHGSGKIVWDAASVGAGVYTYSILRDGVLVHTGKLVITE